MAFRLVRRLAFLLIALYAMGQAGIALAACGMDRGAMAQAMSMPDGTPCEGCPEQSVQSIGAACVAHCVADLQLSSAQPAAALPAQAMPFVIAPPPRLERPPLVAHLPPGGPPRRILLHSYQV